MDIRFCTDSNFDQDIELIKKHKIGVEFQEFYDPFIKNLAKTLKHQKEMSAKIKHKSLHAPFWELNPGTKMPGLRKETMKMYNLSTKFGSYCVYQDYQAKDGAFDNCLFNISAIVPIITISHIIK